jgi:hypothetical protein
VDGLDHPLGRAALGEVVELHAFFEAWLGGTAQNSDLVFSRLENALAETFSMVTPDGTKLQRSQVVGWLRQAYGAKGSPAPFRIAILEPEPLLVRRPLVVLRYVEEQSNGGTVTRRRSTAVLDTVAGEGGSARWLALHETWIRPDR